MIIQVTTGQKLCSIAYILEAARNQGVELREKYTFSIDHMTYPYGIHAAEVAVDSETGKVKIEKYYIAYDVGKAINPMLVHGQLVGGMAQGLRRSHL